MATLELLKQLYSLSLRADATPLSSSIVAKNTRGVWSGDMPPRNYTNPKFSLKIFVGGVPWDIDEQTLLNGFRSYGICHVEWPNKTTKFRDVRTGQKPTGYVYIVFQSELSISFLLTDCIQSCHATPGELYFCMRTGPFDNDFRQAKIHFLKNFYFV